MLHRLKRHSWQVSARFEHCLVLTYAVPRRALEPLLPPGLELDLHGDDGFLAIALVQTRGLRPTFLPAAFGRDFFLSGYRVFTRHRGADGRTRRGLRILRSDTDRRVMKWSGNLLTHYRYRLASVDFVAGEGSLRVSVVTPRAEADLEVVAALAGEDAPLPPTSPFATPKDARRFAGPLPWTFDYEPETHSIVRILGRRPDWHPRMVEVDVRRCTFLETSGLGEAGARLASAFHVADVEYSWAPGVLEPIPETAGA